MKHVRVYKTRQLESNERDFVITKPCISMGNDTRIDHLRARRKQSDEPPTAISCASCDIYRLSRWLDLKGWLQVMPVGLRYKIRKSLVGTDLSGSLLVQYSVLDFNDINKRNLGGKIVKKRA